MSKKTELPQTRRHVMIFDEDWDFLEKAYGLTSLNKIGVSTAIRKIIHAKVSLLRERINVRLSAPGDAESLTIIQDPLP